MTLTEHKKATIATWKAGLDANPEKVAAMHQEDWYSSMVGLLFRLHSRGCITIEQFEQELS